MPPWFKQIMEIFSENTAVDEVLVNCPRPIISSSAAEGTRLFPSPFAESSEMVLALQEFALAQGLRLDHLCPAAGGILPESGFRWHSLIPPASAQGPVLAVRRHRFGTIGVSHFGISPVHNNLLARLFAERKSILIGGPTGSGKSTLLAALLAQYAKDERVVVIEELAELPLIGPGWLRLLAKEANIDGRGQLSVSRLLKDSLRLRPDRLVLGELQRGQLGSFVESIWAGHGGTCATFHGANLAAVAQRFFSLLAQELGVEVSATTNMALDLWCVVMERGNPPLLRDINQIG